MLRRRGPKTPRQDHYNDISRPVDTSKKQIPGEIFRQFDGLKIQQALSGNVGALADLIRDAEDRKVDGSQLLKTGLKIELDAPDLLRPYDSKLVQSALRGNSRSLSALLEEARGNAKPRAETLKVTPLTN